MGVDLMLLMSEDSCSSLSTVAPTEVTQPMAVKLKISCEEWD